MRSIDEARIGMMRAMNHHVEPVFNRARIEIGESANWRGIGEGNQ